MYLALKKNLYLCIFFFFLSVDRQLDTVISTWLMCSAKRHEGSAWISDHSVTAVSNTRSFSTVGSGSEGLSKPYLISYTKPWDFGMISQTFFLYFFTMFCHFSHKKPCIHALFVNPTLKIAYLDLYRRLCQLLCYAAKHYFPPWKKNLISKHLISSLSSR